MEADWEVELGGDAPVIDACWNGLVNLRAMPERSRELPEAALLPQLAGVLTRLNSHTSPVWTSKCDVWPVSDASALDADELDAPAGDSTHGWACYIDLLPASDQQWNSPQSAVQSCQGWCARLREVELTHCRADLIVRQAVMAPEVLEHGVTAYLTACGPTSEEANAALASALDALVHTICPDATLE
jgi:hypothetical protein